MTATFKERKSFIALNEIALSKKLLYFFIRNSNDLLISVKF